MKTPGDAGRNEVDEEFLKKQELQRRLDSYWRLELFCVGLLPGTGLLFSAAAGQYAGPYAVACLLVMSVLLLVGTSYWRAKAWQLNGNTNLLQSTLSWAERLQSPLFVAVISLSLISAVDVMLVRISRNQIDRTIAFCATLLSLLEYINYYHVQLQHCDHAPDLARLLSGRGFRRSRMSIDLQRHRRRNDDAIHERTGLVQR